MTGAIAAGPSRVPGGVVGTCRRGSRGARSPADRRAGLLGADTMAATPDDATQAELDLETTADRIEEGLPEVLPMTETARGWVPQ